MKKSEVCLKLNNDDGYICSEEWWKVNIKNAVPGVRYTVLSKGFITDMEDLIRYCLVYHEDFEIPENYQVTILYNIIFSTGNFDPNDREYSLCKSEILYTSKDKKFILDKFKSLCKRIGKENQLKGINCYCWLTEDYATNQIIHSYNIDESYLIEKRG